MASTTLASVYDVLGVALVFSLMIGVYAVPYVALGHTLAGPAGFVSVFLLLHLGCMMEFVFDNASKYACENAAMVMLFFYALGAGLILIGQKFTPNATVIDSAFVITLALFGVYVYMLSDSCMFSGNWAIYQGPSWTASLCFF